MVFTDKCNIRNQEQMFNIIFKDFDCVERL